MGSLAISSFTTKKVPLFVKPTDINNNPAALDGLAVLSTVSGAATAVPATPDEIAAAAAATPEKGTLVGFAVPEDVAGVSAMQMQGDADLSGGVVTISDDISYTYSVEPPPQAANLNTNAGDPVDK
jgi:hypothetical protein